jgi:hypothetical protein
VKARILPAFHEIFSVLKKIWVYLLFSFDRVRQVLLEKVAGVNLCKKNSNPNLRHPTYHLLDWYQLSQSLHTQLSNIVQYWLEQQHTSFVQRRTTRERIEWLRSIVYFVSKDIWTDTNSSSHSLSIKSTLSSSIATCLLHRTIGEEIYALIPIEHI